jgi:antitoxin (DNA-binding transcriptional repressor) of toxin-antitoxin stability system
LTLSADGRHLLVAQHQGVQLVETRRGRVVARISPAKGGLVSRAVFSPDGRQLAIASQYGLSVCPRPGGE